ncbi:MAG TPA: glutathione S-transferase N-terminal domain-containing protein [Candidatus Cybelea sp.]|nr:glutathione S-transferase N-terminal domain-containing protein [Candidatus Cybelea sp.]
MPEHYRLIGANPSPYSVKMRAIMRYRRLPFHWEWRNPRNLAETKDVRPQVVPILQFPDGSFHVDSTPLAYALERRHPGQRSIIPDDPARAFLCHLIEDMADEWGTKFMFHYRWTAPADQVFASHWIAGERYMSDGAEVVEKAAAQFGERQIGRMPLVGCTPENAPVIEASYKRILGILNDGIAERQFLFGTRPSLAEFGLFGQLWQCAMDPTPSGIMRKTAPRVLPWLLRLDDAAGVEGGWDAADAPLSRPVVELLKMAGEIYLPFLAANNQAIEAGKESFALTLMGQRYAQGTFRYQQKCLNWLRDELAALSGLPRERTLRALRETGCADWLA